MSKHSAYENDENLAETASIRMGASTQIALLISMKSPFKYLIFATMLLSAAAHAKTTLGAKQREARLDHAKELLGRHYKKSTVRTGEKVRKINSFIYAEVKDRLPKEYQNKKNKVAQAIIDEAFKYKFDPVFILSVIQSESSFRPAMFGSFGEIGLMQIKPSTAEWIAKKMDLKYKDQNDLYDPVKNIRIGAAFLSYLRDRFDSHAQLYLSAYNMGQGNVDKALEKDIWPKDYVGRVMKQYIEFYSVVKPTPKPTRAIAAKSPRSKTIRTTAKNDDLTVKSPQAPESLTIPN